MQAQLKDDITEVTHCVFCVILLRRSCCMCGIFRTDFEHYMCAKFHFVDLAGSERVNRTGNIGERFKGDHDNSRNFLMYLTNVHCCESYCLIECTY